MFLIPTRKWGENMIIRKQSIIWAMFTSLIVGGLRHKAIKESPGETQLPGNSTNSGSARTRTHLSLFFTGLDPSPLVPTSPTNAPIAVPGLNSHPWENITIPSWPASQVKVKVEEEKPSQANQAWRQNVNTIWDSSNRFLTQANLSSPEKNLLPQPHWVRDRNFTRLCTYTWAFALVWFLFCFGFDQADLQLSSLGTRV